MTATTRRRKPASTLPYGRVRTRPRARWTRKQTGDQRRDIQGLRMVAVVVVVINHLTGRPVGGFVGVDVFFVISGFLITGHLVRDLERTQGARHYIGNFYRRRVRRLFPAGLLVIGLTLIIAHQLFNPVRFNVASRDGGYAAIFLANWRFIQQSSNYFATSGPESPFRHYWSLSVEEQFYVVWPLALFVLAYVAVGRARRSIHVRRAVVGGAGAVLCAGSLLLAFSQSIGKPTVAYYSTFDRAWELGFGAVLACFVPYVRAARALLTLMSWCGVAMIVVALFTTTGGHGFPAPGALLPCLGAGLVLAAASARTTAWNPVLTNRLAVFIGDISYSIYLVHWPVIVLLGSEMVDHDGYYYTAATSLALGLSILLYALVEQPVLRSQWLLPHGRGQQLTKRRRPADSRLAPVAVAGLAISVLGIAAVAWWPGRTADLAGKYSAIVADASDTSTTTKALPPKARALQAQITTALKAAEYPPLDPSVSEVVGGPTTPDNITVCAVIKLQPVDRCTWSAEGAKHTVYLVGDSTSMVYAQALAKIVGTTPGWKFRFAGAYGCRFNSQVFVVGDPKVQAGCAAHTAAVVAEIKRMRPDTLIVTDSYGTVQLASTGSGVQPDEYGNYLEAQLRAVRPYVNRMILMAPPPNGGDIANCYRPGDEPLACVSVVPSFWRQISDVESRIAKLVDAEYIDSEYWFCDADGYCPPFVGSAVTMHDATHATSGYIAKISPVIGEALTLHRAFGA